MEACPMTANVGTIDRILRAVFGLVLIAAPFVTQLGIYESGLIRTLSVIVGVVMLVVAAVRVCPLYSMIGIRSNKHG
jgi:hypothetical protein